MILIRLLVAALCLPACAHPETRLSSRSLSAVFDAEVRLVSVENRLTGERMRLGEGEQFAFLTGEGEIAARDCRSGKVRSTRTNLAIDYTHPRFLVSVRYELQPEDHFLQKRITVKSLRPGSFIIKRFAVHRWRKSAPEIVFQHGQCLTFFLRRERGGFFHGVEAPFGIRPSEGAESVELAYPVNMVFPAGSAYHAETAYWGVYRLTGKLAPPVPKRIDECDLAGVQPDEGESDAMLRMVEKLSPPPRKSITVSYNGFQGGLSFADYTDPGAAEDARHDVETGKDLVAMLGDCYAQPATPWFGAFRQAHRLTSNDKRLPPSPLRERVLADLGRMGLKPMLWTCWKSVNGWIRPHIGAYASDRPDWQANWLENCPANTEYVEWMSSLVVDDARRGFTGYIVDEAGLKPFRYTLQCESAGHGHLPGDVAYPYFYRRREFYRRLRQTFGDSFELQAQRPQMDAGIWDAVYLNSLFTLSESGTSLPHQLSQADRLREWSRVRRQYTFVPSYMDQVLVQPGLDQTDYLMLSILAVSGNYLFTAPATPALLEQHNKIVNTWTRETSRWFAKNLREFPEADKKRLRHWLDWAREHGAYMHRVQDLHDWPGSGKPDGYLRIHQGRGFAFLFNAGEAEQTIEVPLDESVGLKRSLTYRLTQIYPPAPNSTIKASRAARFATTPRSARLMKIEPLI
jgi:hypothetical protein